MSEPTRPKRHDVEGYVMAEGFQNACPEWVYQAEEADDYMDHLEAEVARLRERVRYYEHTLCVGDVRVALKSDVDTAAISPERVGEVLAERDRLLKHAERMAAALLHPTTSYCAEVLDEPICSKCIAIAAYRKDYPEEATDE